MLSVPVLIVRAGKIFTLIQKDFYYVSGSKRGNICLSFVKFTMVASVPLGDLQTRFSTLTHGPKYTVGVTSYDRVSSSLKISGMVGSSAIISYHQPDRWLSGVVIREHRRTI